MKTILQKTGKEALKDAPYVGQRDLKWVVLAREYDSLTPNGNRTGGNWVLRIDGQMVDFGQYRNDIAERHDFELRGIAR